MTAPDTLRRDLLARNLFELLQENAAPLAAKDAIAGVKNRVALNEHEQSRNNSGVRRFDTYLRWVSSWASAVGWMSKRGGWAITEAGIEALDEHGDHLGLEVHRRYLQRRKNSAAKGHTDPRWQRVTEALALVEAGWWTTYDDLAQLGDLANQAVDGFLTKEPVPNAHRVLRADGTIAPDFRWADPARTDDPRELLMREGLEFDAQGRADPAQRLTADDLCAQLSGTGPAESPTRRAWLVRGSSVDGHDLVHVWLQLGSVSLAAAALRPLTPPVERDALRAAVEEDYAHKSYAAREAKLAEFDAFCNRMRPGDQVLTTTGGKAYIGEITGDAMSVQSSDDRSNLRRTVKWLNTTGPVPFARLPQPLPAKFHSQSDVVELTEDLAAVDELLTRLGVDTGAGAGEKRKLAFNPVTGELAAELLADRDWLQEQADLLWERRQVILYGPPGTGKTYLARELAAHLVRDPSAVKLVQFHPSYTYEDFFEGFRPVPRDDDRLAFALRPGPFRRLVDAAREHPADPYVLVIDEINRANLAKVFGELYFLLEYREADIDLLYSEKQFTLPPNVFVIGTMNTADRSIALLDAAMRRRFAFVELHPSEPPTAGLLAAWLERLREQEGVTENLDTPVLLDALNRRIEDRDLAIGPSYLMRPGIYRSAGALARVWATSILPVLAEQHFGAGPEVLDQFRLDALRAAVRAASSSPP